jgi:DNA mismatch repair protein MutL
MSRIRVLPELLANKIAAGEIVERPASVVKELVENSIDAQARSIHVEIESGGKKRILVRDDGEGMSQDDALLAFEHHATSKLSTIEDLSSISTLGFRGEALPSIASVSRLILRSRHESRQPSEAGTEVVIEGGTVRSVKAIPWDRGTEVTVRDLFFNMPARRKFLRSHEAELGHSTRLVTQYALAHPEMRFTLDSEGRMLMDLVPVPGLRERVFQIFGDALLGNLIELSGQSDSISVHGFASRPHEQRTNPYSQFFYVNRRMVRDKTIMSAVRQAYRNVLPSSAYPVVLLFVDLPFDQVDVNTHPAKIEIRFRQQNLIHDLILECIERALSQSRVIPPYEHREPSPPAESVPPAPGTGEGFEGAGGDNRSPVSQRPEAEAGDRFQRAFNYPYERVPFPSFPGAVDHRALKIRADLLLGAPTDPSPTPFHSQGVRILGQIHESYIIACDHHGLLIVDQHVAHERVLYERFSTAMEEGKVESQGLVVPKTMELLPHQVAILERALPELHRSGFTVERFGGKSILIRSVPVAAKDQDCANLFSEILEGLEAEERTLDLAKIRDRIAVNMACRAAIKVHTPLSIEKMQWLLDELSQTRIPTNCPHGRPVLLRFSLYEIERNFGRI